MAMLETGALHSTTQSPPRPPHRRRFPSKDVHSGLLCDALVEYDARGLNTPLHFLSLPSRCRRTSAGSIVHASFYLECIVLNFFRLALVSINNMTRYAMHANIFNSVDRSFATVDRSFLS